MPDINWTLWDVSNQHISSLDTSINKQKIPKLFSIVDKKFGWKPHTINFDIGGGKFDNVTDYMQERYVTHLIYDPFNRSKVHNVSVITDVHQTRAHTVTISNVLNVVKEKDIRIRILNQAFAVVDAEGTVYIKVYEGDRSGQGKETTKGWQNNQHTSFYLTEVSKIFPTAYIQYGLIIAKK